MKKLVFCAIALAALAASPLLAQDITGTWQGTLHLPGNRDLRTVLKISKADSGGLKATFYSIDQPGPGIPVGSITVQGSTVKIAIPAIGGTYEGKLSNTDATSITGTWTQGPTPLPLDLTLANDKTAWAIPDPPPPPKIMPADAKPQFDVATIKPSQAGEGFGFTVNQSGMLITRNTTLKDLIKISYSLHPHQITGGPSWFETDKYDITGKPDTAGVPSIKQLMSMTQKLLTDRFQLKFHREKKELKVYALTIGKLGIKITEDTSNPNGLPGFGGGGPRGLNVRNATMAEFCDFLQANVLDEPVVDQTGLGTKRYNFILKWTPDGSQAPAGAARPEGSPAADAADAPPDIYLAIQQQLGLKVDSTKAPVDVFVIDHVEKPSDN
jgi:uncharacterized protein (TIGR03435 family)